MKNTNEQTESYPSLDEILGDSAARYFGAGYRMVEQRVLDVRIDTQARNACARAEVHYPSSWSTKSARELTPHLSTIDGLVIAVQLVDAYAREAYGLDELTSRASWLRHCTIRSGATPTMNLEDVPVALAQTSLRADDSAMGGFLSDFKIRVGSLGLDLTLDHSHFVDRTVQHQFTDIEACIGPQQRRYYGAGYKATRIKVSDIVLNRPADRARARFSLDFSGESHAGLSGSYVPFISVVDSLIGMAQLAQAVLYRQDAVTRESSGNLWMRRISVDIPRPMTPEPAFDVETWIRHANVVSLGDRRWRTAKFQVAVPSLQGGEYSIAHELPGA